MRIALYPSLLGRYKPPQNLVGLEVVVHDDLEAILAAQPSLLAALYLPDATDLVLPPVFALGPAAWQGGSAALAGAAQGGQRSVAARALETLGGLLAEGPLPPSPRPLRVQALRESLGGGHIAVAGGGRVGRALQSLAKGARVRLTLVSDHAPRALRPTPWQGAEETIGHAQAVVWATDRPLTPYLASLRSDAILVVLSELAAQDRDALLRTLDARKITAITTYRPVDLPQDPKLVVLSDSPRRQSVAMAALWRHLARPQLPTA